MHHLSVCKQTKQDKQMIRGNISLPAPLIGWIYSYVCEETSLFVSFVLVRHPCAWPQRGTGSRKRCQLCWLHSSLGSTPTHSLIWDACVCPTTCFARWNGSKSSVRVKWFSCVSLTLVRYMLSPAELLHALSVMWLLSSPGLQLCLLTNHIDEKIQTKPVLFL